MTPSNEAASAGKDDQPIRVAQMGQEVVRSSVL